MTRTLRHEALTPREINGAVNIDDVIEKLKVKFDDIVQYCLNPCSSKKTCTSEQLKNIQKIIDPLFQNSILLPDDFAEYIYHIGNACEMLTIYSKWTDPRRKKQQKGQTVSVLHSREPDGHSK